MKLRPSVHLVVNMHIARQLISPALFELEEISQPQQSILPISEQKLSPVETISTSHFEPVLFENKP